MSVAMLKSLAFTFCTPDGESGIAVQKPSGGIKSLGIGLEPDSRPRIGLETWGDNKVDNKVDNNAWGDIKVDNKVDNNIGYDTVNDTVKHSQTNTRATPVQHPYNEPKFRTTTVPVQDPNEFDYLPARKRLNHRGSLSIDVSSALYFITICAKDHAPWIADEVKVGRAVVPRPPSIDLMAEIRSAA